MSGTDFGPLFLHSFIEEKDERDESKVTNEQYLSTTVFETHKNKRKDKEIYDRSDERNSNKRIVA